MNTEQESLRFEARFTRLDGIKKQISEDRVFYYGDAADDGSPGLASEYQWMWMAWQARAAESACTQSELDELYEILNGTPHMEQVTPEVFKLALQRHMREFEARAAECRVPEWWRIVPVTPSESHIESMAIRYDHGLGCPGFYDANPVNGLPHKEMMEAAKRVMRQLYEEAIGEGFYKLQSAPQPECRMPEGWKLVPAALTQDMADAAKFVDSRLSVWSWADGYKAMLEAAPQPEQEQADWLPVPHSLEQARAMAIVSLRWLSDNAPDEVSNSPEEVLRLRDCLESVCRHLEGENSALAVAIKATCESGLGYRPQPEQEQQ